MPRQLSYGQLSYAPAGWVGESTGERFGCSVQATPGAGDDRRDAAVTGPLRVLAHRDFRLIAIGNMVSQLGFWGQYVAVGWAARTLTESDFLVTVAFAAQWFPALRLRVFAP